MKKLRLAIIGCGGFVRGMHVPNIKANPKFTVQATMDVSEKAATDLAQATAAAYATTDVEKILSDPSVDAVLIATRHDSHADLTVRAARAGKHVLCEKPMALGVEEVKRVVRAVKESGVVYTVGYNRGLAPMILKARDLLAGDPHKRMIYHRIQAPFPEDSWTHDPLVGGGRFVGEGCHIFDLMSELVEAAPVSVYAAGGTFLDPRKVKIPDSAIVTIAYRDGSVATTLINSAGCGAFEKESTEIYCDGRAIHIANFQEMRYFGFEGQNCVTTRLDGVDKGHRTEIDLFADAVLDGKPIPNGLVKAARAAVISFKVGQSLERGLPVPVSADEYELA